MKITLIILTCDRPKLLKRCVKSTYDFLICNFDPKIKASINLVIVDDSKKENSLKANRELADRIQGFNEVLLVDQTVQKKILNEISTTNTVTYEPFFQKLGSNKPDIAANRNIGIIAANYLDCDGNQLLWMVDDDIVIESIQLMDFKFTTKLKLFGPKLKGIVDESQIERYLRKLGIDPSFGFHLTDSFLSGGCMFISNSIARKNSFPRFYNEDWIYQGILKSKFKYKPHFINLTAYHLPDNYSDGKVSFFWIKKELEGDIVVDVLKEFGNYSTLITKAQFKNCRLDLLKIFTEQKRAIDLLEKSSRGRYSEAQNTLNTIIKFLKNSQLDATLLDSTKSHLKNQTIWEILLNYK